MRTTTADIRSLIDRIDRGEIRLPEIQRGYVWKPPKVAALVDSLYRRYPTGSLLLWETGEEIIERAASIQGPNEQPLNKPQYLIDGQQRLTSLHRVFKGHEGARIVFNVESERFQNESAATAKDARWLRVYELLSGDEDTYTLVGRLHDRLPHIGTKSLSDRIDQVRKIADYSYYVEILDDLPYDEVTDIFVRVNSRGVPLRSVDLALATLSARWPGVISKLEDESQAWAAAGYPALGVGFLARALAALVTEAGGFLGFATAPIDALEEGWTLTCRGVSHLVPLLKHNAGIATSELLPAANALVPLVAFLGSRPDVALPETDANALVYWLFGAFIQGRYSSSVETVLSQDMAAIRSREPLPSLFRNLRLFGQRLVITEDALVGRTERSPYFLLSYLVARKAGAKDWWHAVDICTSSDGHFKLEYHHIHPRATLKEMYSKNEINDLANLAFISAKANRKISDRSPATYFPEIGDAQLAAHLVPTDESLRIPETYPDFVQARRRLLAQAMTSLLDSFAPTDLAGSSVSEDPTTGESLTFAAYGDSPKDPHAILVIDSAAPDGAWRTQLALREFALFLSDVENGYSAALAVDADMAEVDAGVDEIAIPLGPLLARGSLDEWQAVLEREYAEIAPREDAPSVTVSPAWDGDRTPFPVTDSQ